MTRSKDLFLNTNYTLYLNIIIGSVLAIASYLEVRQGLLFPFFSGWVVFFIISFSITNRLQYEEITNQLKYLNKQEPNLVDTLDSNKEAYEYLTDSLSWATEFKNTVYGTNPPELKRHRRLYVEKTHRQLEDDDFKMHEILSVQEEHINEAKRKKELGVENYYCSFIEDNGCPLLPFSILKNDEGRREVVMGWYGEVLEPHSEDQYIIVREARFVDMMIDHFESSFNQGDKTKLNMESDRSSSEATHNELSDSDATAQVGDTI